MVVIGLQVVNTGPDGRDDVVVPVCSPAASSSSKYHARAFASAARERWLAWVDDSACGIGSAALYRDIEVKICLAEAGPRNVDVVVLAAMKLMMTAMPNLYGED
jgi:uncharacterized protein (DUF169 family)